MKKIILIFITSCIVLLTNVSSAADYQTKIKRLETGFASLQQQINDLRRDMGSDVSEENAQRLANLEAFAVQLNEVLTEVQDKIEENKSEVSRLSTVQQNRPNIGAYGTITAGKSNGQNSIIDGQSFELIISGQPHKRISYFTELEFERAAAVGTSRGGEVLVEQAYTDIQLTSWMNFRGGILLVPFGNIERDHFAPIREVISQPLTSYAIAPAAWSDNGFGINGRFNLSDSWIADYQAYVIAGLDSNISTTGLRQTRQGFGVDNNNSKAFAGKLSLQNTTGFNLGLSYYKGAYNDSGTKDMTGFNIDFDYKKNWFEILGEFTDMDIEQETGKDTHLDGYYIRNLISLNGLLPENFLGADFPHARLSFVTQYDEVTIENFYDSTLPSNYEKRMTFGLRLQPTASVMLNINYEDASATGTDRILRGNDELWIFSLGYVF